jgi:hypothetical protein
MRSAMLAFTQQRDHPPGMAPLFGLARKTVPRVWQLPPVAFDHDVPTIAMYPVMGDPVLAVMRRTIPTAGHPDVTGSIPAMVAVDPNVLTAWRRAAGFDNGSGRSDADHDLRKRGSRHQSSSEQQSWKKFLHDRLFLLGEFRRRCR